MKNNELGKKLGLRIRELRIANKIKQGELADLLDMERSNLTRIESGLQRPNDENLLKIAKILKVEVKDLFDFGHMMSRNELILSINENLSTMNDNQIRYVYKSVRDLRYI